MEKVIIIGDGPAGISAALYAVRGNLDPLVINNGIGALEKAEKIPTKQRRRREYYRYCTRVALGMCMSFALLVTANLTYNSDSQSMPGTVLEEVQQDKGEKIGSETARKDLTAKKSAYEKKQSEMKKKQDTERKKFMEKHRESSGSRSFSINRVFRNLQKYLNIKK